MYIIVYTCTVEPPLFYPALELVGTSFYYVAFRRYNLTILLFSHYYILCYSYR